MGIHHWPFWHRPHFPDGYTSPFLLEILSSKNQGAWPIATGSLTAEAPGKQVVSCSRAASGYCLGSDGLLHLLGANTVRVEPAGLLVEGASTNQLLFSSTFGGTGWTLFSAGGGSNPTVTLNSTDVQDPTGAFTSTKVVYPAVSGTQNSGIFDTAGFAGSGAAQTGSCWVRTASGTASIDLNWNHAGHAEANVVTVTSTWQRFPQPIVTPGAATWFFQPQVDAPSMGSLPSQTLYFWQPQFEPLPFMTSNIPTSGAAASRDADIVTVANVLNPSNPGTWSVGITGLPINGTWAQMTAAAGGLMAAWCLGPGSGAEGAYVYTDSRIVPNVFDHAGGTVIYNSGAFLSGLTPASFSVKDASGTITAVPSVSFNNGAGTGIVTVQPATFYIGTINTFAFQGWNHWTDIYVDNK